MKKKILILTGLAAILASVSFSSSAQNAKATPTGTLVYCSESSPAGFDSVQYTAASDLDAAAIPIFNGLVSFERGRTNVRPALATSWDVSPDGKEWTFHLRKGVKFHSSKTFKSTRDFNADDVIATFDRMLNKNNAFRKAYPTEFPYFNSMGLDKNIKSIQKIDDNTVKFTLNTVDAAFIQNLAIPVFIIHSAQYMNQLVKEGKASQINQAPIGTGPFVFVRYQKDEQIRFKANADYWDTVDSPKVQNLIFAITKDSSVRAQKIKTNECQIMQPGKPEDLPTLKANPNVTILTEPSFAVSFLYYNNDKKPLDNAKVRTALDMAINVDEIVKAVYDNQAVRVANPMPPTQWSYNKKIPLTKFDPEAAKKLLAEAGYPKGFDITVWTSPNSTYTNPNGRLMGEMIQSDWKKIGVNAKLQTYEWGEYLKRGQQGEHQVLMASWVGDNGDPDNWLGTVFACASIGASNYSRFCNKDFEALLNKARQTTDIKERTALYEQAQQVFADQRPATTMATAVINIPLRKTVEGFKPNPFGNFDFNGVSVKAK